MMNIQPIEGYKHLVRDNETGAVLNINTEIPTGLKLAKLKKRKEQAQPSKIKTGGSTFKNPIDQTNEKVWKLIRESVSKDVKFGEAAISDKHSNFFINQKSATFNEMKELIEYVRQQVKTKTGIKLDLEIVLVE